MTCLQCSYQVQLEAHLHIVFENICSSGHVYDIIDDEFAESCEQVSPFVESLDLVGLVLLVSLYRHKYKSEAKYYLINNYMW